MNKKVILSVVIVLAVASIFLIFKFVHKECVQPEIVIDIEKPAQGQMIKFKCGNAEESDNITWDFGDTTNSKGVEVNHKFKLAGTYTIKVTRDENCVSTKEIVVLPKRKVQWVTPQINFPAEIHINEPITFTDMTNDATSWNWKIPETQEVGVDKSFNTKFTKSGRYNITLIVKGNSIKGDTAFAIDVLDGVASKNSKVNSTPVIESPKIAPTPKQEMKVETKPVVASKPEPKPKPEPVVKTEPSPKPKPEPTVKPEPTPKPEVKSKLAPAVPPYISDADFKTSFVSIANALANEDDNASNEWRDKIVPSTGDKGTMKVIIKSGSQVLERSLESFKKSQLISSEPYKVEQVSEVKRAVKNGPITEITIIVSSK
ncbi:MAG: PKD domain-containing protein [Bacteroidota bacterium]